MLNKLNAQAGAPPQSLPQSTGFARLLAMATLLAFTIGSAQVAQAKPSEAENPTMAAFGLGVHMYRQGEFKQAAQMFLTAFGMEAKPDFLFNAARSEQRALMLDEAEKHFKQCLRMKDVSETIRQRAHQHMGEVRVTRESLAKMRAEERTRLEKQLAAHRTTGRGELQGAAHITEESKPAIKAAAEAAAKSETRRKKQADVDKGESASDAHVAKTAGALPKRVQRWRAPVALASGGLGVALLGTSVWLFVDQLSGQEALDAQTATANESEPITGIALDAYRKEQGRLYDQRKLAVGLGAVGVVAAGLGTWLWLSSDEAEVSWTVDPVHPGLSVAWRY